MYRNGEQAASCAFNADATRRSRGRSGASLWAFARSCRHFVDLGGHHAARLRAADGLPPRRPIRPPPIFPSRRRQFPRSRFRCAPRTAIIRSPSATWLGNPINVYRPTTIAKASFANSVRLTDLVKDGKIYLSLSDAIALAIENNYDIAIARYDLDIADTDILRTKTGAAPLGAPRAWSRARSAARLRRCRRAAARAERRSAQAARVPASPA